MDKLRFTRDFRSPDTLENFFQSGDEWCFEEGAAQRLVAEEAAELVEANVETATPEGQPVDRTTKDAKVTAKPAKMKGKNLPQAASKGKSGGKGKAKAAPDQPEQPELPDQPGLEISHT